MNTSSILQTATVLAFTITACQASAPGPLSDEDVAAIRNVTQAWAQATRIGDGGSIGVLYTDDGVELPPDAPEVKGRRAIQIQVEMTRGRTDFSATSVETRGSHDLAYDRGVYSWATAVSGMTEPKMETGNYLAIVRQQVDGSWLISILIWNSDQPFEKGSMGTESME